MPRLEDLRPQHVQALLDGKRDDGQANRSVQYLRTVLRSAMEQTRRWQMIRDNPVTLVRAPSVDRKTIRFLSTAEAQQLLAALEGDRLRSLFALAIGTGLRQGEALGLRWDSIDFDAGAIRIDRTLQRLDQAWELRPPKTKRSIRTIAAPLAILEDLGRHRRRQLEERLAAGPAWSDEFGLVFTRPDGSPLHGTTVTKRLRAALRGLGIDGVRFHDLRHTSASLMLERGVPLSSIQEVLGHADYAFTKTVYSHLTATLKRDAAHRMNSLFELA